MADSKDKRRQKGQKDDNEKSQKTGKGHVDLTNQVSFPIVKFDSYEHNMIGKSVHLPD
ncbi:Hypothetical predicted protein, partial [Paramuricea clavata]